MHHPEADRVIVEHRGKHAADGALLAPHLDADGLLVPEVAAIGPGDGAGVSGGIVPCRCPFERTGFIDDPFPGDDAFLAGFLEKAIHALHFRARHRGDQAGGE
jgi:hypothetical protein